MRRTVVLRTFVEFSDDGDGSPLDIRSLAFNQAPPVNVGGAPESLLFAIRQALHHSMRGEANANANVDDGEPDPVLVAVAGHYREHVASVRANASMMRSHARSTESSALSIPTTKSAHASSR
jgi:hypothetical protein